MTNDKAATPEQRVDEVTSMSMTKKANKILERSQEVAARVTTWADFSLEIFDQHSGLVAKTFRSEMERQAFYDSEQYKQINAILTDLMKKTGVVDGATPSATKKSGRFNVRMPKTLHCSLEIEAKREGVSLNQLVVAKLALPLRHATDVDIALLVQAFADVHEGFSSDRIVVDPDYNGKFLRRCRELGLTGQDVDLNHALFNIRKSKKQREQKGIKLPQTTRKTEFRDFDDYQYAAEIAARLMQRTEGVTLDRILCDPVLAKKFDEIALQLVNEIILKLRWAALNLRKTHRLQPIDPKTRDYDLVSVGPVGSIDLSVIAELPGLYVFYDENRPLFAGETEQLRSRISKHMQYGLPCVDVQHDDSLVLRTSVMPKIKQAERVRWLMGFVNRERPLLNYQKAA